MSMVFYAASVLIVYPHLIPNCAPQAIKDRLEIGIDPDKINPEVSFGPFDEGYVRLYKFYAIR